MKYAIFLALALFTSCCKDNDAEEFKKNCPYELIKYPGHYLKVPVTITPHKLQYHVGDTILISTIFSDSIYDLSIERAFKIEGFPFKPLSLLYHFTDSNTYDSGYRVNELSIDSSYHPVYFYSSEYADGYRAYTIYENNQYRFESRLVLKEPGRYILGFSDLYEQYESGGAPEYNAEADAITFEGKCPTLGYSICNVIEGDSHLELFEQELVYLDNNVYRGALTTLEGQLGPLKGGGIGIEFSGYFGFEVIE